MNIFDCAITMEEKAKSYYQKLEKESTLPEQRNLYSLLAAAEQQHIDTLQGMKERTGADGAEVASCWPEDTARPLFDGDMENDPDLFLHVVHEEEQDIGYYEALAAKAEDSDVRVNLLLLAEEERKHLEVVENVYSYAEAPRNFLAYPEFSNLEEL